MSSRIRVDFFFDVISPYSWYAFEALCRFRTVWPIDVHMRPFALGHVMAKSGNTPPAMQTAAIPNRALMMATDVHRSGHYWGVPLHPLEVGDNLIRRSIGTAQDPFDAMFNKGSLAAQRLLVSVRKRAGEEKMEEAARELWMRRWSRDQDIHATDNLLEVCKAIQLPPKIADDAVANVEHHDTKEELKRNTQEALDVHKVETKELQRHKIFAQAFGAPWIVVHHEGKAHAFFGSDRFHIIADLIGEKYPGPMRDLVHPKAKL